MRLSFRVFSKQVVENAKSCTPYPGITLFVTPISRERIGWFPMLKLRTHFAIDSQKDLNAHKHLTNRNLLPRDPLRAPPNKVLSLRNQTLMYWANHEGDVSDLLRLTPVNITTPDKARTTVRTPRMVE